jgi:hypothetical protein
MFCCQDAEQNHNLMWANVETIVTNENGFHEVINSRLNLGNTCYHFIQDFLSSCLHSKKLKIKINKATILPAVLYGLKNLIKGIWEKGAERNI